jgi:MSHA pilin protein MshA
VDGLRPDNKQHMEIPMNNQKGFTLIELVAVIVILGALAVTAIPQFIDLQDEADEAAVNGVAGSLASGAAVNYAGVLAGDGSVTKLTQCKHVANTLNADTLPDNYSFTRPAKSLGSGTGDTTDCAVGNGSSTATFQAIYASP